MIRKLSTFCGSTQAARFPVERSCATIALRRPKLLRRLRFPRQPEDCVWARPRFQSARANSPEEILVQDTRTIETLEQFQKESRPQRIQPAKMPVRECSNRSRRYEEGRVDSTNQEGGCLPKRSRRRQRLRSIQEECSP